MRILEGGALVVGKCGSGKEEVELQARKEWTSCIEPIIHTRGLILQKKKKCI